MNKPQRTSKKQQGAFNEAAECLRILAHPHRLRIVQLLLTNKQYSVNELAEACGTSPPVTSDHFRLRQRCGFQDSEKTGRSVYNTIVEPLLEDIIGCLGKKFKV